MFKIVGVINYLFVVFLNAFTDLGHKIIIQNTIFKVTDGSEQIVLTAIVNALILLPFLLVFSPAGFLADRFAKNIIMKYSSIFAIFITLLITYAYYHGMFYFAFAMTFVLALQSAIYAPAKYGYIKELVGVKFISSGNSAVQAVTTVAILLGIIFYTLLFENLVGDSFSSSEEILKIIAPLAWLLVIGSVIEWFLASRLPNMMIVQCKKKFKLKKYFRGEYLKRNMIMLRRKKEVFNSVVALGLFWSISQVILAIFPEYVKGELGITNTIVVQGMMALAVIGIVLGSIIAARLSKHYINIGLAGLGSIGLLIVVILVPSTSSVSILSFEFALFGLFSGLIIVPLNARIQLLSANVHLGTILAGNNFIQTLLMFSFLMLTTFSAYHGLSAKVLFYLMALVGLYLSFILIKRYFVKIFFTFVELLLKTRHRYNYVGLENIPKNGAVLLLGNHVSWIDWFIIQLPINRRVNFLIERDIYYWKFFHFFFKLGELIPVSAKASKGAFVEAYNRLKASKIVALYPEAYITSKPELGKFYKGYELINKDYDGVIVPYYIEGVFGSIFARCKDGKKSSVLKKREITVYIGEPLTKDIKADDLREIIKGLKK